MRPAVLFREEEDVSSLEGAELSLLRQLELVLHL